MHWLHVKPNSDFLKIRQFFGRFLSFYRQIFCRFLSPKSKRRIGIWQTFGLFFCLFSPFGNLLAIFWQMFRLPQNICQTFCTVSREIEGKEIFFLDFGGEFWVKTCQKTGEKVPIFRNSEFGLTCSQCITFCRHRKKKQGPFCHEVILNV